MKKNSLPTLIIGLLLMLVALLVLVVFQVRKSEVAVVTFFGRTARAIETPGPHLRLPWPIESVHRFDQRVQNFEDKFTEGSTQDGFTLLTSVYVGWRITDASVFYPKFTGGNEPIAAAEQLLEGRLTHAKAAVTGKHPLADFLSSDAQGNKFLDIEKEILSVVQAELPTNSYGLKIEFLGVKRLGLPESVTQSVFDRMQSERKLLADKLQWEGESDAAKIRSDANRRSAEIIANANSEATRIQGEAEAEAAKSLAVFQQNPELASFIFRLAALENSLKDRSTLIFDQSTVPFDILKGASTNLMHK
jgi:membrane protease subunit HflC